MRGAPMRGGSGSAGHTGELVVLAGSSTVTRGTVSSNMAVGDTAGSRSAGAEDEMSEQSWVEVYRAEDSPQAHLLKSALEDAGIRAAVEGDLLQGAVGEPGEWWAAPRIMVAECDALKARAILEQLEDRSGTSR
jgi:Putative prokaryotic signal transducing protein